MSLHICITGANRGIGLGLTLSYLQAGHTVWAVMRQPEQAKELEGARRDYGNHLHLIEADVTRETDVNRLAEQLGENPIDVLINNAGVLMDPAAPFTDIPLEVFRATFETNVFGSIAVTQKLIPALKRSKHPILAMISSQMGSLQENTSGGSYAYRSSKAALNMILKSLAHDYPWLIAVTLHPGWVQTRMGGPHATTPVADSIKGITQILSHLEAKDSGSFLDYKGRRLAW